jgi:polar amino acid transport system ATP-binding protein
MTGAGRPGLLLQISGLRKEFNGRPVLDGITMTVGQGEVVFVIGPSGSGKSTLLRCINRLEEASAGSIRFDGEDIAGRGTRLNRLRQQIGFVFQAFNLYPHMTALGNVALALRVVQRLGRAQAHERAIAALHEVGLAEKATAYPAELSGGQQQRVAIARALVLRPRIMLFDEPTSALDPELIGEVQQVMLRFRAQGMTMVIVSHEMRFAQEIADRVIFLDQGRVVEEGAPDCLFANPREARTRAFLGRLQG